MMLNLCHSILAPATHYLETCRRLDRSKQINVSLELHSFVITVGYDHRQDISTRHRQITSLSIGI